MATYYVAVTGDDSNDGLSEVNAFASPGKAASVLASEDVCWVKSGTYVLTTSTPGPNGPVSLSVESQISGYHVTPGDIGSVNHPQMPIIDAGVVEDVAMIYLAGNIFGSPLATGFELRGNGNSGVACIGTSAGNPRCCVSAIRGIGCPAEASMGRVSCTILSSCGGLTATTLLSNSVLINTIGDGVNLSNGASMTNCIIANASGRGVETRRNLISGCIIHGNGENGMYLNVDGNSVFDCIVSNNAGVGIQDITTTRGRRSIFERCAFYQNTGGDFNANIPASRFLDTILLTESPYTNAAGDNYTINDEIGGGKALRELGIDLGLTAMFPFGHWWTGIGGTAGFTGIRAISRRLGT